MQHSFLLCVFLSLVALSQAAVLVKPQDSLKPAVAAVPVPHKPNVTLPDPHGHPESVSPADEPVSCSKLDACLAQADGKHEAHAASDFKACIQKFCEELYEGVKLNKSDDTRTAICDEKGREVWKHISKAVAKVKISFIELRTSQPDTYNAVLESLSARAKTVHMAEVCRIRRALRHNALISSHNAAPVKKVPPAVKPVPVPAETEAKLPVPHNKGDETPATCSRLDVCLKQADANDATKAAKDFKSCIQDFCEEAYEGIELNKTDDARTQLCDEKGKELWNYIAKQSAKAKTGSKASFIELRRSNPDMYATVLKSLAALTSVVHVAEACVMPQDEKQKQQGNSTSGEIVRATKEATAHPIVPVPEKPNVPLPDPHGTPDSKKPSKEPRTCSKLDVCLAEADASGESKAAADFQACIQKFCEELYADGSKKEHPPQTKNVLCDQKGKEVWGYIAKQGAKVKTGKVTSLLEFRTRHPDTYTTMLMSLFAHASDDHLVDACRLDRK